MGAVPVGGRVGAAAMKGNHMKVICRVAILVGLLAATAHAQSVLPPMSSAAIEGSHIFCLGPCKLYTVSATSGASAGFVEIFNQATDPADGSLSGNPPVYCWNWPASTGQGYSWALGAQFTKGMTVVYSTGADCLHKTESATAFFTVQVQ
jgi:hypothetical protein